jgi:hypothetical protein
MNSSEPSFPRISATITEVADGFTVTVWLRQSAGLDTSVLLTDEPIGSIDGARAVISSYAMAKGVRPSHVDEKIDLHDFLPEEESRH